MTGEWDSKGTPKKKQQANLNQKEFIFTLSLLNFFSLDLIDKDSFNNFSTIHS